MNFSNLMKIWIFILVFFSSYFVVAVDLGCCLKAGDQQCQYITKDQCGSSEWYPGTCDQSAQCKPGCCDLTDVDGTCMSGVPEKTCTGKFLGAESCGGYDQCSLGCCIIGNEGFLTTEKGCNTKLSELGYDIDMIFDNSVLSEPDCVAKAREKVEGCCITDTGCKPSLSAECDGSFVYGKCSDQGERCPSCKDSKWTCQEGSFNLFKLSSCGDVLEEQSCGLDKMCSDKDGTAKCVDTSCKDTWKNSIVDAPWNGGSKKSGESWCQYESATGPGLDLPGTRQWRHYCEYGEEVVDLRSEIDNRQLICESWYESDRSMYGAKYVENKAIECIKQKTNQTCLDVGQGPGGCVWVGDESNGFCVPWNSQGVTFWEDEPDDSSCSGFGENGAQTFNTAWAAFGGELIGEMDCQAGCEAFSNPFALKLNKKCNLYGDCGAKFNVLGKYSENSFTRECNWDDDALDQCDDPGNIPINFKTPTSWDNWGWDLYAADDGGPFCRSLGRCDGEDYESCKDAGEQCDGDGDDCGLALMFQCRDKLDDTVKSVYPFAFDFNEVKKYNNGNYLGEISWSTLGVDVLGNYEPGDWQKFGTSLLYISAMGFGPVGEGSILYFTTQGIVGTVYIINSLFNLDIWDDIGNIVGDLVDYLYDHETEPVTVTCGVWEPLSGGENCNLCQEQNEEYNFPAIFGGKTLHPCTPSLCHSLGKGCEYVESGDFGKCLNSCGRDVNSPRIVFDKGASILQCTSGNCGVEMSMNGVKISGIKALSNVNLVFKTCKSLSCTNGQCSCIDPDEAECEFTSGNGQYREILTEYDTHNATISAGELVPGVDNNYNLKCKDVCGNTMDVPYVVVLSVGPQSGLTSPVLSLNVNPLSGSYVANDQNTSNIDITIDQVPKECKWDTADLPFEQMQNRMHTIADVQRKVSANVNITEVGEHSYYFKCKNVNDIVNVQNLVPNYKLIKTDPLSIASVQCITPLGTACDDLYYPLFDLVVQTAGGIDVASCGATESNEVRQDFMFTETGTSHTHKTTIGPRSTSLNGEKYTYNIVCNDKAGNVASQAITLNLIEDKTAPIIEKYYREGTLFVIETNEWAECYYNGENKFDSSDGLKHLTNADKELYVISCKDRFENKVQTINVHLV